MRRLTLLLLFVVTTINMMCAQVPQGFTYQAIVRNNDGTTIANSQVSVRIELVSTGLWGLGFSQHALILQVETVTLLSPHNN